MEKTEVKVYFRLYGEEFPINLISQELNLKPTHSHEKGKIIEKMPNPNIIQKSIHGWKETVWELGTDYEESLDVEIQIKKVTDQFKGREARLVEICKRYNLNCMLMIVIRMNEGYTPALVMKKEIIDFVNHINAEIHFDLYANPYK